MNIQNYLLKLQYDGSCYHGYQIQPVAITIQKVVEDALSDLFGKKTGINGCSRTDAGVHAIEYACSFFADTPIPAEKIPIVVNNKLPQDIRAISCLKVNPEFHARFDTQSKTYLYKINTEREYNVFARNYEWQIRKELDYEKMCEACKYFIGEKDFRSFMTSGTDVETTVRTIYDLHIEKSDENHIEIYINANGYLYNMVRIITGTLVEVGLGRIQPNYVKDIIEACNREKAGQTAPPQGLYLFKVNY